MSAGENWFLSFSLSFFIQHFKSQEAVVSEASQNKDVLFSVVASLLSEFGVG